MTTERSMTAPRIWLVAIMTALLVIGAAGFSWAYGPGRMMHPATYPSSGESVGHCPWADGQRDGDQSWIEQREQMLHWQRHLLEGRQWNQLTPAQRWALWDRVHDSATQQWGSGDYGWMHRADSSGAGSPGRYNHNQDRDADWMMHN
jgi:hypothetical protein